MRKILIVVIFFTACKNNNAIKEVSIATTNDSLISTIVGKWGGDTGEPVWEIKKDSIHYYNEKKSYYYLIHEKDMIVLYKEGPYMLHNIHTVNDTLFFDINNEGMITKAFRKK
jgi:hypothetical protein